MNNKDKYIIFFDVDGTLVNIGKREIKQSIIDEIDRIKSEGHIPVIATGRPLTTVKILKGSEHFMYYATLFGSVVTDAKGNSTIIGKSLDVNDTRNIVKYVKEQNLKWHYKYAYGAKTTINDAQFMERHKAILVDENELEYDISYGNVFQLWVEGNVFENANTLYPNCDFYQMPGGYFDVTYKGVSKNQAIQYLKSMYPNYKTVSVGDSNNDIAMFENTDISIAMGNAKPEIQKLAQYVTLPLDDNGIVYAIRNILKI